MSNNRPQKQLKKPVIKSKKDVWYKLDLSATVYPTLQRRDFSSVYRLSVKLKETVNPALLQQALDLTLPRFPTYKVAIRKGLFWRYLEPNNRPGPFVQEDIKTPVCLCTLKVIAVILSEYTTTAAVSPWRRTTALATAPAA